MAKKKSRRSTSKSAAVAEKPTRGRPPSKFYTDITRRLAKVASGERKEIKVTPRHGEDIHAERLRVQKMIYQKHPHGLTPKKLEVLVNDAWTHIILRRK